MSYPSIVPFTFTNTGSLYSNPIPVFVNLDVEETPNAESRSREEDIIYVNCQNNTIRKIGKNNKMEILDEDIYPRTSENEKQTELIKSLVKMWEQNIQHLRSKYPNKSFVYGIPINVVNTYGITFEKMTLSYVHSTKNYEFSAVNKLKPNIFGSESVLADSCNPYGEGKDIQTTLTKFMNCMNNFVFCDHCGRIRSIGLYDKTQEMCQNCLMENYMNEYKNIESEYCSICLEHTKTFITTHCGHKFHRACISKLKKNECPMCRKNLDEATQNVQYMIQSEVNEITQLRDSIYSVSQEEME